MTKIFRRPSILVHNKGNAYEPIRKIKKIETYVGGYFGGYHQVEVDLENNSVTWTHGGEGKLEESVYRNIRSATAKNYLNSWNY